MCLPCLACQPGGLPEISRGQAAQPPVSRKNNPPLPGRAAGIVISCRCSNLPQFARRCPLSPRERESLCRRKQSRSMFDLRFWQQHPCRPERGQKALRFMFAWQMHGNRFEEAAISTQPGAVVALGGECKIIASDNHRESALCHNVSC